MNEILTEKQAENIRGLLGGLRRVDAASFDLLAEVCKAGGAHHTPNGAVVLDAAFGRMLQGIGGIDGQGHRTIETRYCAELFASLAFCDALQRGLAPDFTLRGFTVDASRIGFVQMREQHFTDVRDGATVTFREAADRFYSRLPVPEVPATGYHARLKVAALEKAPNGIRSRYMGSRLALPREMILADVEWARQQLAAAETRLRGYDAAQDEMRKELSAAEAELVQARALAEKLNSQRA